MEKLYEKIMNGYVASAATIDKLFDYLDNQIHEYGLLEDDEKQEEYIRMRGDLEEYLVWW